MSIGHRQVSTGLVCSGKFNWGLIVKKIVVTTNLTKAGTWGAGLLMLMPAICGLSVWWLMIELGAYNSYLGRWKVPLFFAVVAYFASVAGVILLVIGRTLRIEVLEDTTGR